MVWTREISTVAVEIHSYFLQIAPFFAMEPDPLPQDFQGCLDFQIFSQNKALLLVLVQPGGSGWGRAGQQSLVLVEDWDLEELLLHSNKLCLWRLLRKCEFIWVEPQVFQNSSSCQLNSPCCLLSPVIPSYCFTLIKTEPLRAPSKRRVLGVR